MTRNVLTVTLLILATLLGQAAVAAPSKPHARVVVVGGGLAGLLTAYELQKSGISAHVLEAQDRWGGRVATASYGPGLAAEYGMHEIWDGDPITDYVKELHVPLSEAEEPYSSVVIQGRLYPYVQDSAEAYLATVFTTPAERQAYGRWHAACEKVYDDLERHGLSSRTASLQKISFASWVQGFGLPARVSEFVRLSLECEFATDWDQVSAIYGIEECSVFLHGTQRCRHAVGGNQRLVQAIVHALRGPKTLGARVTRIVRQRRPDGRIACTVQYMKDNRMHTLHADRVVVAVPYHLLHAIQMEPTLTPTQWKAVETLDAGRYEVVHFLVDTAANKLFKVNGQLPFPVLTRGDLGVVYGILKEPPAGQKTEVFSLLIHGDASRFYLEPQDAIRPRLIADLEKLWPGFGRYVKACYFYSYHPAATPSWPVGRSNLDDLARSLRVGHLGLYLAGDYVYIAGAEGAVRSARNAAQAIAHDLQTPGRRPVPRR